MAENGVHVIATKVNHETYVLFKFVAFKTGVKIYNLLQTIIESYVRYFSGETVISDDIKRVLTSFGRLSLSKYKFVLSSDAYRKDWYFSHCIAFIGSKRRGFEGNEEAILLRAPREGEKDIFMNRNNDAILEALFRSLDPDILRNLQTVKKEKELPSLLDALRFASSETANDETDIFEREINELFSDNERSEYGVTPDFTPYKRRNKRNIELMSKKTIINNSDTKGEADEDMIVSLQEIEEPEVQTFDEFREDFP